MADDERRQDLLERIDAAIQYYNGQRDSVKGTVFGDVFLPALRFLFERLEEVDTLEDGRIERMDTDLGRLWQEMEQARGTHSTLHDRLEQGMDGEQFITTRDGNLLSLLRLMRLDPPKVALPYAKGKLFLPVVLKDAVPDGDWTSGQITVEVVEAYQWEIDNWKSGGEADFELYWQGKRLGVFRQCMFGHQEFEGVALVTFYFTHFDREEVLYEAPDLGQYNPPEEA